MLHNIMNTFIAECHERRFYTKQTNIRENRALMGLDELSMQLPEATTDIEKHMAVKSSLSFGKRPSCVFSGYAKLSVINVTLRGLIITHS